MFSWREGYLEISVSENCFNNLKGSSTRVNLKNFFMKTLVTIDLN